jgi:hypothetical protein
MNKIEEVEKLLNLEDHEIYDLYRSWDKGDCSLVGLIEILLFQEIKNHKKENGQYYDTDYDLIRLRIHCGKV